MEGMQYLVIAFSFGLATGIIGRAKGSSFFIWFLVAALCRKACEKAQNYALGRLDTIRQQSAGRMAP